MMKFPGRKKVSHFCLFFCYLSAWMWNVRKSFNDKLSDSISITSHFCTEIVFVCVAVVDRYQFNTNVTNEKRANGLSMFFSFMFQVFYLNISIGMSLLLNIMPIANILCCLFIKIVVGFLCCCWKVIYIGGVGMRTPHICCWYYC